MKRIPVDELTRLAFHYAKADRLHMLDTLMGCTNPTDVAYREETRELINQMRAYMAKRWGKRS